MRRVAFAAALIGLCLLCNCQSTSQAADGTILWITPAISDVPVLPETLPPSQVLRWTKVRACRGEYEPVSFCVRSSKSLSDLRIQGQFSQYHDCMPRLDIRYVKCWWQSGPANSTRRSVDTLIPELLLKDPSLVTVHNETKRNAVRQPIRDAKVLQSINLAANFTQQYLVTIYVPSDCKTGFYYASIKLYASEKIVGSVYITVEVLPFDLPLPYMKYSIFYRGKLESDRTEPLIGSEIKTRQQYRAELKNMREHGVLYPQVYESSHREDLEEVINLRKEAGMVVNPLYWTTLSVAYPGPGQLRLRGVQIRLLKARLKLERLGIYGVYAFGKDEAREEMLAKQRPVWEMAHETGVKVFATSGRPRDLYDVMGGLPNLVLVSQNLDPWLQELIESWHKKDVEVWFYGQTARELPETFRRDFGLKIFNMNFDGASPYAYQAMMGASSTWDDWNHKTYKDHIFAYPTLDGVVDTVHWEGFREGIDDVRYATLLRELGGEIPGNVGGDLDMVRSEMIDKIITLKYFEENL